MTVSTSTSTTAPNCTAACQAIRSASSQAEVMRVVRDYLNSFEPGALAAIPISLLTLQINSAHDVASAAVELARHEAKMAIESPQAALVKEVAMVLSTAAMRLALLTGQGTA